MSLDCPPAFVTTHSILLQFGPSAKRAQGAYRKLVSANCGTTVWESVRGQIYLGSDEFIEHHVSVDSGEFRERPRSQSCSVGQHLASS